MSQDLPYHPRMSPEEHEEATARLQESFSNLAARIVSRTGPDAEFLNSEAFIEGMFRASMELADASWLVYAGLVESEAALEQYVSDGFVPQPVERPDGTMVWPVVTIIPLLVAAARNRMENRRGAKGRSRRNVRPLRSAGGVPGELDMFD
ncbi:MAG: hypothetical protein LCH56_17350 [Proteobacteria bacterium]|nr:hypothetical protein [Pseudomonadota bacterium]